MLRAGLHARIPHRAGVTRVWNLQRPTYLPRHALLRSKHPFSQSFVTTKKSSASSGSRSPGTAAGLLLVVVCTSLWTWSRARKEGGYLFPTLSPNVFNTFTLVDKQEISSTCAIFTLRPVGHINQELRRSLDYFWDQCAIWSIEIKQPQLQIARAYTPLPPIDPSQSNDEIRLLVRREPEGEVSRYIHNLPINAKVEIRGGFVEATVPTDCNDVVFVAGGTAIAPALQVAYGLQRRLRKRELDMGINPRHLPDPSRYRTPEMPKPRESGQTQENWFASVKILWANRRREDCREVESSNSDTRGIIQQFQQMRSAATDDSALQLSFATFVDEEESFIRASDLAAAIGPPKEPGSQSPIAVFFNGPGGFMDYIGGLNSEYGFPSFDGQTWADPTRSKIGGLLAQLDLHDRNVMIQRLQ